jgi:hypothetical protein
MIKIIHILFLAALCFLSACNKKTFSPTISSYWQVSENMEDGWTEYINKPMGDLSLFLKGTHQGAAVTNEIINRGQYLSLKRRGFTLAGQTHYEIKVECLLDAQLSAFMALLDAKPSRISYVRNIKMNKISMDDLPCTLAPAWDQALICDIEDGKKYKNVPADYREKADKQEVGREFYLAENRPSYNKLFGVGDDKIKSADAISLCMEDAHTNEFDLVQGYGFDLTIVGWGDVNNDGIEDLVCLYFDRYIGGTGGYSYARVLTRLKKNGPLFELPIKRPY